jgi:hypothetical protein
VTSPADLVDVRAASSPTDFTPLIRISMSEDTTGPDHGDTSSPRCVEPGARHADLGK